ncbi:MAG: hypothetical protein PVF73_04205 [Bacteroidales bacterium]|jgi:predicted peroxiredoxin
MKHVFLTLTTFLLAVSCTQNVQQSGSSDSPGSTEMSDPLKDGIFIHITESYDDPHRLLMPLKMATLMADDKDVLVYMDIHAVKILVEGSADIELEGFEPAHTYLKSLIEKNIGIYACPTCLKVAGYTPEELMEGIDVARKDRFFDFTEGKILTIDY